MSWLPLPRFEDVFGGTPVPERDALDVLEVYPVDLEWGPLAEQLLELGLSRRDVAVALALAVDPHEGQA